MDRVELMVVDDDDALRSTLARFLEQEGYLVIAASEASEVRESDVFRVEVILLDVNLPGESGFDLARRVRQTCPHVGIIMLTGRGELVDRVLGLELGADDYIQKPFELRELLARIRSVQRRVRAAQDKANTPRPDQALTITFQGWTVYVGSRRVLAPCGREVNLTTTEFEILKLLSDNRGQTVTRQRLYDVVRGKEWSPLDRTLDTHVANLRKKLESTGGEGLIKSVHGQGYVLAVN